MNGPGESRDQRRARLNATKEIPQSGARFAPLNALRDGGWISELPSREIKVWLVLWSLADRSNRVRVSHGTLAAICGIRREHAARTTKALERRGLLKVLVRGRTMGQTGKRTANVYEVLVPTPFVNSARLCTIPDGE
jgi:CRP-like cAMP-binding protein